MTPPQPPAGPALDTPPPAVSLTKRQAQRLRRNLARVEQPLQQGTAALGSIAIQRSWPPHAAGEWIIYYRDGSTTEQEKAPTIKSTLSWEALTTLISAAAGPPPRSRTRRRR